MNAPEAGPSAAPRWPYRWSKPRIVAFLAVLGASGSVAAAARAVGISRNSAYRLRRRLGPDFGAVWDEGVMIGRRRRLAAASQGDSSGAKVTAALAR